MEDSLPNIYYPSESNKFINMANHQLSSSSNSNMNSATQKSDTLNLDHNITANLSEINNNKSIIPTKENPFQNDDFIPEEISGTLISISNFSVSNENIIIGGITLHIKDDNGNIFEVQANPKDLIIDIIERYRKVANIKNNHRIFFMKENGEGLHRKMSLEAQGVGDKNIILAKQLDDKMRQNLKEKIKKGFIYFMIDYESESQAFYGKGNVMFKIFADKFREKYPGEKFSFRYNGDTIQDEKITIEELGFNQGERIFAQIIK